MKKVSSLFLVAGICILQACNNSSKDSVDAAKDSNENKMDTATTMHPADTSAVVATSMPVDKNDADFAVEAANGGMMEVELGNYAQQNAMNQRVKDFGAMMVRDHTKANDQLKALAASKNITLPASTGDDAKKDMEGIMKKKGKDFDKAYIKMMVDDHEKDVKHFEKASKDCKDTEIKNFAATTLPVLQQHLDSAKAIKTATH